MSANTRSVPSRFGPYLLLERLGFGGHGAAYLATDPDRGLLAGTFVIKVLHDLDAQVLLERFQHEAEILRYIQSRHVVRVLESGVQDGEPYLAMELAPGWRVSKCLDIISASGRHPALAETIEIFAGGLRGLSAIHGARHPVTGRSLEVVHRDITPKNLMVDQSRVMRIIDFGLGRSTHKGFDTRTGILLGTPGYMAPEVVAGRAVDHRADLYAFAVILWEWLTLKRYIPKGSLPEMLAASKAPPFVAPSSLVSRALPEALDEVLRAALEHEPSARFASAEEMLVALEAAVDGELTEAAVLPTKIYVPTEYERAPNSPSSLEPTSPRTSAAISDTLPRPPEPGPGATPTWAKGLGLVSIGLVAALIARSLGTPEAPTTSSPPTQAPALRAAPAVRAIAEPAPPIPEAPLEPSRPTRSEPASERRGPPRRAASRELVEPERPSQGRAAPESVTVEDELTALRRLAADLRRARPELAAEVAQVLDRAVMDAAIRDRATSLDRVQAARRKLESIANRGGSAPLSPDTTDSPR